MNSKALLVDGMNLVRRVYAAVPGAEDETRVEGARVSVERTLRRALEELSPTHAACVFDPEGPSWRHGLHPAYKCGRVPMPMPLRAAWSEMLQCIEGCGIRALTIPEFEADDVLASMAVKIAARGGTVVILSTDRGLCQLLGPGIRVRDHFGHRDLGARYIHERFGVEPKRLTTLLALCGDSAAGIPGVKSVGVRTAAGLIEAHGGLESILETAKDMPGRIGAALRDGADDARLSLRLVTMRTDVPVGINLKVLRYAPAVAEG